MTAQARPQTATTLEQPAATGSPAKLIRFPVSRRTAKSLTSGSDQASREAATVDQFRSLAAWSILAGVIGAILLAVSVDIRVDPANTSVFDWLIAALLLVSRIWWGRRGHVRIADACGTIAVAALGGMTGGAIAMLELRLGFPLADPLLNSIDHAMGVDGIAFIETMMRHQQWLFPIIEPAYDYTLAIFFVSLVALSAMGNRVEAWRAALCFVGTLLTTCVFASVAPAKGLGMFASPEMFAQLPPIALRSFWAHFDDFYSGSQPVLRIIAVDGVISFPSFHVIVAFLTVVMWRGRVATLVPTAVYFALVMLAIFPYGGHYFIDMVGGLAVGTAWVAGSLYLERRLSAPRPEEHRQPLPD